MRKLILLVLALVSAGCVVQWEGKTYDCVNTIDARGAWSVQCVEVQRAYLP